MGNWQGLILHCAWGRSNVCIWKKWLRWSDQTSRDCSSRCSASCWCFPAGSRKALSHHATASWACKSTPSSILSELVCLTSFTYDRSCKTAIPCNNYLLIPNLFRDIHIPMSDDPSSSACKKDMPFMSSHRSQYRSVR